jgi:cytochrome P450
VTTSCLLTKIILNLFGENSQLKTAGELIDESIALATPALEAGRVTSEAIEIGGLKIPERETVIALLPAANRDLIRLGVPISQHMAFGAGRHRCSGADLVSEQVRILASSMKQRGLQIELIGDLQWQITPSFRGIRSAPARWL